MACRAMYGISHPAISERLVFLAALLWRDQPGRAERLLSEAQSDRELRFDAHDWRLAEIDTLRALLLYTSGAKADASELLENAVRRFREHLGKEHPRSVWATRKLGYVQSNVKASAIATVAY